jgi:hypothetical protein
MSSVHALRFVGRMMDAQGARCNHNAVHSRQDSRLNSGQAGHPKRATRHRDGPAFPGRSHNIAAVGWPAAATTSTIEGWEWSPPTTRTPVGISLQRPLTKQPHQNTHSHHTVIHTCRAHLLCSELSSAQNGTKLNGRGIQHAHRSLTCYLQTTCNRTLSAHSASPQSQHRALTRGCPEWRRTRTKPALCIHVCVCPFALCWSAQTFTQTAGR